MDGRTCAAVVLAGVVALAGCAGETLQRNVYEGARSREEGLRSAPPEPAPRRAPGYDDYDRERRGLSAPGAR